MKQYSLEFYKSQKTPNFMQEKVNAILSKEQFKFAIQNESPTTGKVLLSLFTDDKIDKVSVTSKVFRHSVVRDIKKDMDKFLEETSAKMKFCTQSFVGNLITTVLFYE